MKPDRWAEGFLQLLTVLIPRDNHLLLLTSSRQCYGYASCACAMNRTPSKKSCPNTTSYSSEYQLQLICLIEFSGGKSAVALTSVYPPGFGLLEGLRLWMRVHSLVWRLIVQSLPYMGKSAGLFGRLVTSPIWTLSSDNGNPIEPVPRQYLIWGMVLFNVYTYYTYYSSCLIQHNANAWIYTNSYSTHLEFRVEGCA